MTNYVSQDCVLTQAVCFFLLILERFVIFTIFENKYFPIEFTLKKLSKKFAPGYGSHAITVLNPALIDENKTAL